MPGRSGGPGPVSLLEAAAPGAEVDVALEGCELSIRSRGPGPFGGVATQVLRADLSLFVLDEVRTQPTVGGARLIAERRAPDARLIDQAMRIVAPLPPDYAQDSARLTTIDASGPTVEDRPLIATGSGLEHDAVARMIEAPVAELVFWLTSLLSAEGDPRPHPEAAAFHDFATGVIALPAPQTAIVLLA